MNRSAPLSPTGAQAQGGGEVRAWMRRWAFDGVDVMALPKAERPRGWHFWPTTEAKCLDDDVPLYTAPPSAPAGVPVDVVREYLDARACYEEATRRPNSHAPAPVLKHGDPAILRLREARVALDNAIAFTQQPSTEAQAQAQGGGEVVLTCGYEGWEMSPWDACGNPIIGTKVTLYKAPPSAPAGVDLDKVAAHLAEHGGDFDALILLVQEAALAQQPASGVTHADHVRGLADMLAPEKQADTLRAAADAVRDQRPAAVDGAMVERAVAGYAAGPWAAFSPEASREAHRERMRAALHAALAQQPAAEAERKFFSQDFYEEAREGKKPWPDQQPAAVDGVCEWDIDEVVGLWGADCGVSWTFIEGGPAENKLRHCPNCGKPVALAAQPGGSDNDR